MVLMQLLVKQLLLQLLLGLLLAGLLLRRRGLVLRAATDSLSFGNNSSAGKSSGVRTSAGLPKFYRWWSLYFTSGSFILF